MSDLTNGFKISDLPEGTVVAIEYVDGDTRQFTMTSDRTKLYQKPEPESEYISPEILAATSDRRVTIISVPWAVTRKLAEWLDNVYTKTGTPENLVVEAGEEIKKDKHTPYISDRPKKGDS